MTEPFQKAQRAPKDSFSRDKYDKSLIALQLILIVSGFVFLSFRISRGPLVDYDEAYYAQVTMDTLDSGDFLSLKYLDGYYLEKPPLYFWLSITSVKIFGEQELAFRLPSVLLAVGSAWLIFLIVRRLTRNSTIAVAAFYTLLFTPQFFAFSREARVDSGVIFCILLALYFLLAGWRNRKKLFWIFPAVAVGFMFKATIAGLALPVLLIFSLAYRQWSWLKSRILWYGLLPATLIVVPWHWLQLQRFGSEFWDKYFIRVMFGSTVSRIAGGVNPWLYSEVIREYYIPWLFVVLSLIVFTAILKVWQRKVYKIPRALIASFFCGSFILLVFSLFQTKLSTYILPIFPFFAMFIAIGFFDIFFGFRISKNVAGILFVPFLVWSSFICIKAVNVLVTPVHYEERALGLAARQELPYPAPLYLLDWPYHDTIRYYADTDLKLLAPASRGELLKGPLYFASHREAMPFFYDSGGVIRSQYKDLKLVYKGKFFFLFYSDSDLTLPDFGGGG